MYVCVCPLILAVKIHHGVKKDGYYEGCVFIRVSVEFGMLEFRNQTIEYEGCVFIRVSMELCMLEYRN